ncbi:metal-dependent hydrolase [Sphingorhabdus arenilitoris]|uniref:Metal-dependent hydrolase n=1 Tax=Sphingorhabdus arenilitoris TaxID=1490041 RepID=A0ABV8RGA6_9SPHN
MDNLTHSLAGAVLGQMGLKRKTGLAMPTLIIAANIPDIDAVAVLLGGHQHLALRRGITHGPIAMLILPLLLWAIMVWFDRWQTRRGKRPEKRLPLHKGWLLALAYIGTLSHPALDWLNSYGIRFLEPFSSQWFYGDTIFIIDIWIWAALIAGVWFSLRRERKGYGKWQRPAWISFTAICAYIFANGLITGHAEAVAYERLQASDYTSAKRPALLVVANPVPIAFWQREILWRDRINFGQEDYSLLTDFRINRKVDYINYPNDMAKHAAKLDEDMRAYLFWSRMPYARVLPKGKNTEVVMRDQRFSNPLAEDRFTATTLVPDE